MGDSLGCLKVVLRGFLCSGFSTGYSGFCHCCTGAKAFVWLDRMLHHRADPTNAMIGGDNSQTRSPWGSTGEATDQDMLAPDLLPHPPQTSLAR